MSKLCEIGTSGQGLPCLININTLSGVTEPCEACAPHIGRMRVMTGWRPFRGGFFMSSNLAEAQIANLLARMGEAEKAKEVPA